MKYRLDIYDKKDTNAKNIEKKKNNISITLHQIINMANIYQLLR